MKNCDLKITVLGTEETDPLRHQPLPHLVGVLVLLHQLPRALGLQPVALAHRPSEDRRHLHLDRLHLHLELQHLLDLVPLRHPRHSVALVLPHLRPAASLGRRRLLRLPLVRPLHRLAYLEVRHHPEGVSLGVLQVRSRRRR